MNDVPYPWVKKTYKKEEEEKMKKLITILTIMIVLVGAAFATDSAQITVNATVSERVPSFKLTTTGNTAVLDAEATAVVIPDGEGSVSIKSAVADALADGIKQLLSLSPEERFQMGKSGRDAVLNYFTYVAKVQQFQNSN